MRRRSPRIQTGARVVDRRDVENKPHDTLTETLRHNHRLTRPFILT